MKEKRRNLVREEFQLCERRRAWKRDLRDLGYGYGYRGKILMFFSFLQDNIKILILMDFV